FFSTWRITLADDLENCVTLLAARDFDRNDSGIIASNGRSSAFSIIWRSALCEFQPYTFQQVYSATDADLFLVRRSRPRLPLQCRPCKRNSYHHASRIKFDCNFLPLLRSAKAEGLVIFRINRCKQRFARRKPAHILSQQLPLALCN
ncbi:MAG: hypothetical protein RLZ61_470, partial [Planctomycetota bacterium]